VKIQGDMKPLVSCRPETTLREVLNVVVENGVHRVFIEDNLGHILGVVTLTDILQVLFHAVH
jgi:CBS domain-containing protein